MPTASPLDPQAVLALASGEHRAFVGSGVPPLSAGTANPWSIQGLVARQVALTPDRTAVICADRSLTWRELDNASNRLANTLRARSMAPDTLVAVALDRSLDLVVALLGVLKAGSAYVPLDPNYPPQRLSHVLDNARPAVILSRTGIGEHFLASGIDTWLLDADAPALETQSAAAPPDVTDPEDLAYVIYTSGSTGLPKGVKIPHRAVVNFLNAMRVRPGLDARDVFVAVTTISFDIAVLELFLPLITGATLVLAREDDVKDGAALCQLLRLHHATALQATPITWQLLLEAGWAGDPPLKMLCGGEAMSRKLADALLACGGELWNMYGPTETTVWSSALRLGPGTGPVPLGGPIAETQFYVLDDNGNLAAPGEAGELHIGGAGVALGYLGLPELTAQRFVPDPFRSTPEALLYRTGDVVRVHEISAHDYWLEYLGRADRQVKLRGFRIELGEIESTLMRHADVMQAVAIVRPAAAGDPGIFAYVVLRMPVLPTLWDRLLAELRVELSLRLPAYMHPIAIMALAQLPRMPNGKIDRDELPVPPPGEVPVLADNPQLPGSLKEAERRLALLWGEVLGTKRIDPAASFFSIGGHSLLAARLLLSIEREFGIRLPLASLFAAATIEDQARLLQQHDGRRYDFRQSVQLHSSGSRPTLFAIHNTGVYYYNLSTQLGPDQPVTALQLFDPAIPRTDFPDSIEAVAREYVSLIRTEQPRGPYHLLGWCVGGVLAFEIARQLEAEQQAVSFVGMIDSWAPGNLQRMSPPRALLVLQSYRLQLVWADLLRVVARKQRLSDFVGHRPTLRRWLHKVGVSLPEPVKVTAETRHDSSESYDRWLDGYLDGLVERYTPLTYGGRVTLLTSAREPRGWFPTPLMGWERFAPAGIDAVVLDGDHFTVFQGEGLAKMATTVRGILLRLLPN